MSNETVKRRGTIEVYIVPPHQNDKGEWLTAVGVTKNGHLVYEMNSPPFSSESEAIAEAKEFASQIGFQIHSEMKECGADPSPMIVNGEMLQ